MRTVSHREPTAGHSRRALLAAGRGAGWLAAIGGGREAGSEVVSLVLDDPRWDRQVEQRAEHYATLLLALGTDIAPLGARAHAPFPDESDGWLLFDVLGELARRGHAPAAEVLHAVVTSAASPHAQLARDALLPREEGIARPPRPASRLPDAEPSVVRADEQLALIEAFLRADARAEALAPALRRAERVRERRHWLAALRALPPPLTLPHARAWLDEPWPLSLAAEHVLADHATEADREGLEARTLEALTRRSYFRLCSLVDALGTIGDPASIATLCRVHDEAAYSYARMRALSALARNVESEALRVRSTEGLWDCDASTRAIAVDHCPLDDAKAHGRLVELAADPFERAEIREAAREALAG